MLRIAALLVCALTLVACQSVEDIQLSKNTWQVSGSGVGRIGVAGVNQAVLKRAAELTLANGYDRFAILEISGSQGVQNVGSTPIFATTTPRYGGGSYTRFSGGGPVIASTKSTSAVVRMFAPGDAGYQNALDANEVLAGG